MVIIGLGVLFAVLGPGLARLQWKQSDGSELKQSLLELGRMRFDEKAAGGHSAQCHHFRFRSRPHTSHGQNRPAA